MPRNNPELDEYRFVAADSHSSNAAELFLREAMKEFMRLRCLCIDLLRRVRIVLPMLTTLLSTDSWAGTTVRETLRVAYFKGTSNVVFFQAEQKGYFKEQGLDVQLILTPDGTAAVAAVTNGTVQLASAGLAPVLSALDRGSRLRMLAGINLETPSDIMFRLVASQRSGVQRISDLRGKTIVSSNHDGLCELAWRDWLSHSGVGWTEVKVLHESFSHAQGLLEVGDADAACLPEPFFTALRLSTPTIVTLASGLLVDERRPHLLATLFGTEAWLSNHANSVSKFKIALGKAVDDLRRDPLAYRRLLVTEFGVPGNVAGYLSPAPSLFTPLSEKDIFPIVEGMQRTRMLSKEFSIANAIAIP